MTCTANRHQIAILAVLGLMIGLSACDNRDGASQPGPAGSESDRGSADATTQALSGSDRAMLAETLPYADIDEQLVYGRFSFPADMVEPIPAIILIHDRWGLDESIHAISRRLAADGYIVIAVDLFGGGATESPSVAREYEIKVFENPDLAAENIRQAYQFVKDSFGAPAIATVGLGFGGGWSLNAAMLLPEDLDASVIFYGQVIDDLEKLTPIQAPVLGLFGEDDRVVRTDSVLDFEAALNALDKEAEIEIFAGVGRGFVDTHSTNHDPEIAELAWRQTLSFLGQHLKNRTE
jgi:carboxymethylenebutenolidase